MADEPDNEISDHDDTPSFSTGRRVGFGFTAVVGAAALFAILVMVNYLSARHFERRAVGGRASQALSTQTHDLLRTLTNDVRVVILFDREAALYSQVSGLLTEYKHASPRIKLEYVDYVRDADAARLLRQQYRLNHLNDKDLVLFDAGGRVRTVYQQELSDYDYSELMAGKTNEVYRTGFKGERLFSSAILSVTDPRPVRAYYLLGHGEHNPQNDNDQEGYAKFIQLLQEKNITPAALSLVGTNDVPADCSVLVIAGPVNVIPRVELDKVEKFLATGGRALVLLNSFAQNTGLERLLANWGVAVGNNVIIDARNTVSGSDLVTGAFGGHPAVRGLLGAKGLYLLFPRTVEKLVGGGSTPDVAKVEEIIFTSQTAVAATEFSRGLVRPTARDRTGAMSVAVAVEKGGLKDVTGDRGATRMVVVGESVFLGNNGIEGYANRDFASLALNWLLDRPTLLGGLAPQAIKAYRLNLTRQEMFKLRLLLLGVIPGGVLLLGALVWFQRRR